ncbi:MAG TPA: histidine kinase [Usitatibacter sp.]|nr:histidine kinase [Usitatibacter sp.]
MKSLSDVLHRTPWWALLAGGFVAFVALVAMVTPIHLIGLERAGATPEQKRAIKNEIRSTFSEGAIDMARGIVMEMRSRERDPAHRKELDRALQEIEKARQRVGQAGEDARQAGAKARESVAEALREAHRAIDEANRETSRALEDRHEPGKSAAPKPSPPAPPAAPVVEKSAAAPVAKSLPPSAGEPDSDVTVKVTPFGPDAVDIQMHDAGPSAQPVAPLPPEVRERIRSNIRSDLYRMGVGGALILVFIPLFILTVVAKIFIDRSRVAQRVAESERREADYQRMSRQVTEAKLSALQAQVEPHFLYNTLASVQALTEVDPQRANAMTGHLIQYLRNALPKMRESLSTVGQEVELVRAYLNILQMRMGERLAFEITVAPGLESAPFPPLMLPSLVENAIKHGLEPQREGGKVTIAADGLDGKVRVTVADTGRGLPEAPGQGVGLANIRERLAALYGDAARLVIEANVPQGVRATLEVPREAPSAGAVPSAASRPAAPPPPPAPPNPASAAPKSAAARTMAAVGSAERAWRKGLSFAFVVLVAVAAVCAGLAVVGILTGALHVRVGHGYIGGAPGALIGAVGVTLAFVVVVLALAIVAAVVYGLGFLFAGLAIFVPIMVLVALFPVLAPFVLLGLLAWWLVRRASGPPKAANPPAPPAPPAP